MSDGIGYIPEDLTLPVKFVPVWNAGKRATFSPPKEDGYRVKASLIFDKFARRVLRARAWGVNKSRIALKLDRTHLVKAKCRDNTENSHEAARLFASELIDQRKRRLAEGTFTGVREPRAAYRARTVPGRGAQKRRLAKLYPGTNGVLP